MRLKDSSGAGDSCSMDDVVNLDASVQLATVTVSSAEHHQQLVAGLWSLLRAGLGVDVQLDLSGAPSIAAHSLLLRAFHLSAQQISTAALEQQQQQQQCQQSLGPIKQEKIDQKKNEACTATLYGLLEFAYTGRVTVAVSLLESLLQLAKSIGFDLLVDAIVAHRDGLEEAPQARGDEMRDCRVKVEPSGTEDVQWETDSWHGTQDGVHCESVELLPGRSGLAEVGQDDVDGQCVDGGGAAGLRSVKLEPEHEMEDVCENSSSADHPALHLLVDVADAITGDHPLSGKVTANCERPQHALAEEGVELRHISEQLDVQFDRIRVEAECYFRSKLEQQTREAVLDYAWEDESTQHEHGEGDSLPLPLSIQPISHLNTARDNNAIRCTSSRRSSNSTNHPLFPCDVCGKSFAQRRLLRSHQISHAALAESTVRRQRHREERPNSGLATVVPRTDTVSLSVAEEEERRRASSGVRSAELSWRKSGGDCAVTVPTAARKRPYECDVCGRVFTRRSVLVDHGRIHTGEKPYKCSVCPKAFAKRWNMLEHQLIHSGAKRRTRGQPHQSSGL